MTIMTSQQLQLWICFLVMVSPACQVYAVQAMLGMDIPVRYVEHT